MRAAAMIFAWLVCAAASVNYNVLPHFYAATDSGWRDSSAIGAMLFYGACVLVMTAVPQAIMATKDFAWRVAFGMFGALLVVLSWQNALDQATHRQASETHGDRATITSADSLNAKILDIEANKKALPKHEYVSAQALSAAEQAAKAADKAAETECGSGRRHYCEERTKAATEAHSRVTEAARHRGVSEKEEALDAALRETKDQLAALGAIPKHADSTAAQVAETFSWMGIDTEEKAAKARVKAMAAGVELMPMIGVAILTKVILLIFCIPVTHACPASTLPSAYAEIMSADARPAPETKRLIAPTAAAQTKGDFAALDKVETSEETQTATNVEALTSRQPKQRTRKPPVSRKASGKPQKSRGAASVDVRPIRDPSQWLSERVTKHVAGDSRRVRSSDAYDDYVEWCGEKYAPVTSTMFGRMMKDPARLAVPFETDGSKVTWYFVSLKPKFAVISG